MDMWKAPGILDVEIEIAALSKAIETNPRDADAFKRRGDFV